MQFVVRQRDGTSKVRSVKTHDWMRGLAAKDADARAGTMQRRGFTFIATGTTNCRLLDTW